MIDLGFGEDDVRRLGGEAAFAWADLLQRGGHVLEPTNSVRPTRGGPIGTAVLSADVRGVWRRVDRATATVNSGRIVPSCGCGALRLCRHVAALLLHWLRASDSFEIGVPAPAAAADDDDELDPLEAGPDEEIGGLLEAETMAQLRAIARERGVAVRATSKADLVDQLAPALADPAGIDAALAGLGPEEHRTLEAVHLVAAYGAPTQEAVAAAYAALGGAGQPLVERLLALGLLFYQSPHTYSPPRYWMPWSVASRRPPREDLLPAIAETGVPTVIPTEPPATAESRPPAPVVGDTAETPRAARPNDVDARPSAAQPAIALDEVVLVLLRDLADHEIRWRPDDRPHHDSGYLPPGWRVDPAGHGGATLADLLAQRPLPTVRLLPPQPPLFPADLRRLTERCGASSSAVWFVLRLLAGLGVVEGLDRQRPRQDGIARLFAFDALTRLDTLSTLWLSLTDWTELPLVVGDGGPLELRCQLSYGQPEMPEPDVIAFRRAVAGLIGRMAPGTWHDVDALVELLSRFRPCPLVEPAHHRPHAAWFAHHDGTQLRRQTPVGWQQVARAFAEALLGGPLSWLGLVDVAGADGRVGAFRVRPASGLLGGREGALDEQPADLVVGNDLTVLVPPGAAAAETHAWLARLGELVEATGAGLRYRLTAERAQTAFDDGLTGPEVVDFLAAGSRGPLPAATRTTLDRWWAGYGRARLYDELCLVELGDDFLLPELLASTPLPGWLVHTFSPRLIAVEPAAVDELVAALARLGHAPRVVEGG